MRLDSHQHFWEYDPQKHDWIDDSMQVLRRNYLPRELEKILKERNLEGTIAVQADQSEEETRFLLELAKRNPFIKGVVGWVNLRSTTLQHQLRKLKKSKKLVGFRHVLQGEPEGFMLNDDFVSGVSLLPEFNFSYDILVFHHQLPEVIKFVERLPDMRLVIDHCAKPDIKNQEFDEWRKNMTVLAEKKHIYLKISGLITEANWDTWTVDDIRKYIETGIELFGVNRVMFGSDWPVCTVAGSYDHVIGLVEECTQGLSEEDRNKLFGENARRFYQIED